MQSINDQLQSQIDEKQHLALAQSCLQEKKIREVTTRNEELTALNEELQTALDEAQKQSEEAQEQSNEQLRLELDAVQDKLEAVVTEKVAAGNTGHCTTRHLRSSNPELIIHVSTQGILQAL